MAKTKATKRRGKLTKVKLTDKQLDELAVITEQDIAEARAFAKKYGSPAFNAMINADKVK